MLLRRYATISVPAEVKEVLEKAKGNMEWGEFLLKLYLEARRIKRENAFRELVELLSGEDLEAIAQSSEEFRKGFALG
ncbi:MAG: antitoxin VapB family protein [Thermofilaceae archaeon]